MPEVSRQPAIDDNRRFVRLPYESPVRYRDASQDEGYASVKDIGRGGIAVRMGRYLRPGTPVMVTISDGHAVEQREELKARVAWSYPVARTTEFQAGLQIVHDEPAAVAEMSRLVHRALVVSGKLHAGLNVRERDVSCWQMKPAQQAPIVVGL